jgi:hypothetical protein
MLDFRNESEVAPDGVKNVFGANDEQALDLSVERTKLPQLERFTPYSSGSGRVISLR